MKAIIKQAPIIIAITCVIGAVAIAIIGNRLHPSNELVNNMERAFNKGSTKVMSRCFAPDTDAEVAMLWIGLSNLQKENYDTKEKVTIHCLPKKYSSDEDGLSMRTIMIYKAGNEILDAEVTSMSLEEVDGKLYLAN